MTRATHIECGHCNGTGKIALCWFCKGPKDDRMEVYMRCDACAKPFCDDHGQSYEDGALCNPCARLFYSTQSQKIKGNKK